MHKGLAALISGTLLSRSPPVGAHDFWVQPNDYWPRPDVPIAITLQVGHGSFRQRSPIPARRITRFEAIDQNGGSADLRAQLQLGEPGEDADFLLANAGTYILVLQTDAAAQTHLPALRFNDYLTAEGLTPALDYRTRLHLQNADGSERYSRCAKSIVQIGGANPVTRSQVTTPVGLPLEIVPEESPYATPRLQILPIRVMYAGLPLPGALVKLTNLADDASPFESRVTDYSGHASFTMPYSGSWLLNVIWTRVLSPADETDFETVFSSLSFGFPPHFGDPQ